MKIAVIGGGAIGSVMAGFLAKAAENTEDILLVGRGDHVKEINKTGLRVVTSDGDESIRVRAATCLDQEYDLVIFTVKTMDLEQAYQDNHSLLEAPWIMTTQNGVQGANILCSHFDPKKMISSIVMFGATYLKPGEVTLNFPGKWIMGKTYAPNDETFKKIAQILGTAFPVVVTDKIMGMKWLKIFVNFNNCIPALLGKSMQETFADMDFCKLSILLLKEGLEVVEEAGIGLVSLPDFPVDRIYGLTRMPLDQAAGILQKTLTTLSREPLYGSILQSLMRHRSTEIDFINGEVCQVARSLRRQAPLNIKIVDLVHEIENSRRFFGSEEVKEIFNLN